MYRIVEKRQLSELVFMMKIQAPLVAESRQPGQFVILQVDADWGERIPLTIADADPVAGTVTIAFQPVGYSTKLLATKEVGDELPAFLGPLGNPSEIENFGHVVCVGGGFGTAPLYPIVKALKEAGNKVTVIIGYRNKGLIIMEDEMKAVADEVVVMTDDGSYGRQGVVTIPLKEMCESAAPPRPRHRHRSADHDEVLRRDDAPLRHQDDRLPQHDHDRRHGHVRRLPRGHRRRNEVCLR